MPGLGLSRWSIYTGAGLAAVVTGRTQHYSCVEDVTVIVWQSPLPGPTRLYLSLLVCGLYRVTCNSRQAKAASLSVPDSNSWSLKQPLLM